MTFGASCICLCSFHLGFLPFPFFHFPPWLYAVSSGPFPEFSEISNLFSMAFPFLGSLAVLPLHPSTLETFKLRSFLWSRSYISSYLSVGNSFTLLFYTFFHLRHFLFFFAFSTTAFQSMSPLWSTFKCHPFRYHTRESLCLTFFIIFVMAEMWVHYLQLSSVIMHLLTWFFDIKRQFFIYCFIEM